MGGRPCASTLFLMVNWSLLQVCQLRKQFGGFIALNNVSLQIDKGSITGLMGPNGAGKSTLFDVISGLLPPTSGHIYWDGHEITGKPPHILFSLGVLRTFQIPQEFDSLTVRDNLMMVPAGQFGEILWNSWFHRDKIDKQEAELAHRAKEVMQFLTLTPLANEPAGNLSGGQKKLLELGRTMMVDASIVLFDEVGAGVNRTLLGVIGDAIVRLNREWHYTFCMIEHDFSFVSKLCDPIIVLAEGQVLAEGSSDMIGQNEQVVEAYLGLNQSPHL